MDKAVENNVKAKKGSGVTTYLVKTAASGLGTGYCPVASGTAGSFLAAVIWWFMPPSAAVQLAAAAILTAVSIPISTAAERLYGKKDDSRIVIDEFVGMWVSLLFLPHTLKYFAAAFIAFRVFDVVKPFGIRKIQYLKGGWGIVADDFFAGVLAGLVVRIAAFIPELL